MELLVELLVVEGPKPHFDEVRNVLFKLIMQQAVGIHDFDREVLDFKHGRTIVAAVSKAEYRFNKEKVVDPETGLSRKLAEAVRVRHSDWISRALFVVVKN